MMKKIFMYFGKRAAINAINDLLLKNKGKVSQITSTISVWTRRLELIIVALNAMNARVVDGELTDDELKESAEDVADLIKKF